MTSRYIKARGEYLRCVKYDDAEKAFRFLNKMWKSVDWEHTRELMKLEAMFETSEDLTRAEASAWLLNDEMTLDELLAKREH